MKIVLLLLWASVAYSTTKLSKYSNEIEVDFDKEKNFVYSPSSIYFVLGLLRVGASGASKQELDAIIGNHVTNEDIIDLMKSLDGVKLGNGIFTQNGPEITPHFHKEIKKWPSSLVKRNANLKFINDWIEHNTGLKDVITSTNWEVALVNTISFNKSWETKLRKESVFFTGSNKMEGEFDEVDGMNGEMDVMYGEHKTFNFMSMDYEGNEYKMVFVDPKENYKKVDLNYVKINGQLQTVEFTIPNFEISSKMEFNNMIPCSCSPECAKLEKITGSKLFVDKAYQKAKISVSELGTGASAASVVLMFDGAYMIHDEIKKFYLSKPFEFYLIHKKSDLVLFAGRVNVLN